MARAHSSHAARQNLSAFLHKLRKNVGTLVVDEIHLLDTEFADLLLAEILTLAAARASGASTRPAGTTRSSFTTASTGTAFAAASAGMSAFTAWCTLPARCARHARCGRTRSPHLRGERLARQTAVASVPSDNLPTFPMSLRAFARERSNPNSSEKMYFRSAGRRVLFGCRCGGLGSRGCGTARTARCTHFALVHQLFLALQIFVESHSLILDDRVLHTKAAFQFMEHFAMRRAHLLVEKMPSRCFITL